MNSFSFLIAFATICALPISYGNPIDYHGIDCGTDGATLVPGQILPPGNVFPSGNLVSAGPTYNTAADCNTGLAYSSGVTYNTGAALTSGGAYLTGTATGTTWTNAGSATGTAWTNTGYDSYPSTGIVESVGSAQVSSLATDGHLMPTVDPCPEPSRVLIHQQRHPIIVNRPATNVVVNQPAVVVKPNPVVIKRPPGIVVRPVIQHVQPKPVKVQPVFVRVIRPVEKHFVRKTYADDCEGPVWSHTKVVPDC